MDGTSDYTIFCITQTEDVPFSVEIAPTATVDKLKEMIKAKNQIDFASIDARKLTLYRIDATGLTRKERREAVQAAQENLPDALDPVDKLFKVYSSTPPADMIHIFVQHPPLASVTPPNRPGDLPQLNITPPSAKGTTYDTATSLIKIFLVELNEKIESFLTRPRQCWMPPDSVDEETRQFYANLNIPSINEKPSLLTHNLDTEYNPNVDDLFRAKQHQIVCNTSGAGKTRLLSEGLSRYWGFYFVATQDSNGIGSRDLQSMIDIMPSIPGWTSNIFKHRSEEGEMRANKESHATNERIASTRISRVLLARWLIFEAFVNVSKKLNKGNLGEGLRHDWLLFQIHPPVMDNGFDPFLALADGCLAGVDGDVLRTLHLQVGPKKVLGSTFKDQDSFVYVLDEAQAAGSQHTEAFVDVSGEVSRPVLRPIIRQLAESDRRDVKIIVSGTGFSLELFKTALASSVSKNGTSWETVYPIGDFTSKKNQLTYISRYLPPSFLCSPSGDHLKDRSYEWLRGRPRLTARFLEEVLRGAWKKDRPASPHKLLNAYVHSLTKFTPRDCDIIQLNEEPDVKAIDIGGFEWNKINRDPKLLSALSIGLYRYITRGQYPLWKSGYERLVEYGLASFIDRETMTISEPIALVSIVRHFKSQGLSLEYRITEDWQDRQRPVFEQTTLIALTKLLQGARLDDVLQFHEPKPTWAHCTAQIVTRTFSGQFKDFDLVTGEPIDPSAGIAISAKEIEDVQNWLDNGRAGWCIPPTSMGPDLLAWLRLGDDKFILLAVQAKCYFSGNEKTLSANVTTEAIESLLPTKYFASLVTGGPAMQAKTQEKINSMLSAINGPCQAFTSGTYNILRVVSAYPLQANFGSPGKGVIAVLKSDDHALALLPHDSLISGFSQTPDAKDFLDLLAIALNRGRGKVDNEAENDQADSMDVDV